MSIPTDREERAMLAALAALETEAPEEAAAGDPDEGELTLRRLSLETLGLLPWALDPEPPSAGARERLLAALSAPSGAAAHDQETATVLPIGAPKPDPSAMAPPAEATRRTWPVALAAAFAVAALGLAGLSGWLWLELEGTQERLAAARGALAGVEADRTALADRLALQEAQLRRRSGMEEFVAAASTAGVEICPLRPVGDPALLPEAFAVLYMPPGSQKWYLVASNLRAGDDEVYRVWLNTPEGAVPVGRLEVARESTLDFSLPPAIHARTEEMLSIVITLETDAGAESPRGPMVLFGDEKMTVL